MSLARTEGGPIAYQGWAGANSHVACQEMFPALTALSCPSFEDALEAVAGRPIGAGPKSRKVEKRARFAMIPIENSANGRVADIHRLLPEAGLHIVGEFFMPIHHCLMAPKGATIETLRSVESHEQALGQCRSIIAELKLKKSASSDTAGAARDVAQARDPGRAALAPALAAEIYDLDILRRDVEDAKDNTTRFVVLSDEKAWAPAGRGLTVTTFVFKVKNIPAALYKALGGFATNGVNMTKLESYQLEGKFTATQFYADVEGHPKEPALKRALDELRFFSSELAILGVYPAHDFRVAARALEAQAAARRPARG